MSLPDRTRNLANRYVDLSDENLVSKPLLEFFGGSRLKKQPQRFA